MDTIAQTRGRAARILALIVAACIASMLTLPLVAFAQTDDRGKTQPPTTAPPAVSTRPQPTKAQLEEWRRSLTKIARPRSQGCFTATYPEQRWREVTCTAPTGKAYPPKRFGGMTNATIVGGTGPDFTAVVTGNISQAEGSFDAVTIAGTAPASYSLQLNTDFFSTSVCSGLGASCRGWEQFVYDSVGNASIQYWLITIGPPGTACPAPVHAGTCAPNTVYTDGWCPFTIGTLGYCAINGPVATSPPAVPVTSLGTVNLAGMASGVGGAANDQLVMTVGGTAYQVFGNNRFPDLGSQWQRAEFNVFGNCCSSQANFGSGTSLTARTAVSSGTRDGPGCALQTWTGESTNLTLVNSAPAAAPGSMPALVFSESFPAAAGAAATCADATSVGDTHLLTFNGLYYDFQATGDFVLADRGPSFVVQNRQVSGAPTWPNASVNSAVGTRMGKTTVAICLPDRIEVNGKSTVLKDGESRIMPDGVAVTRNGNAYLVANAEGDSIRAQVYPAWIDVSVGLGLWPTKVRGLLANANNNVNQLAMSDGTVLTQPIAFEALYHRYGQSWRVKKGESILCKDRKIEEGVPSKPFYAKDLDRQLAARTREVCLKAGVKEGPLLEACMLDVAVIGNEQAAKVFAKARAPVAVAPH